MNFDSTSGITALLPRFLCFTGVISYLINTPIHPILITGVISYLINTPIHPILITGDDIITYDCLALSVISGTSSSNQGKEQEIMDLLGAFIKTIEIEVWRGHDVVVG